MAVNITFRDIPQHTPAAVAGVPENPVRQARVPPRRGFGLVTQGILDSSSRLLELPEDTGNLLGGKTPLLEETHLAAAFREIRRQRRPKAFQPHLFNQLAPLGAVFVQAPVNEAGIDSAFPQPGPDLLRPLATLVT